jgi:hypothetical protein
LVTCGRDNQVVAWSADGAKLKSFEFTNDLPARVTFSHDGERVAAADWTGRISVWETKTGTRLGELAANPPTLAQQIAACQQRLSELQSGGAKPSPAKPAADTGMAAAWQEVAKASNAVEKARAALAPKEEADAKLKAQVIANRTPELEAKRAVTRVAREEARLAVTNALAALEAKKAKAAKLTGKSESVKTIDPAEELAGLQSRLAKLKAAQVFASVYALKESIAARKREQEKLIASGSKADKAAADKLAKQIAKDERDLQKLSGDYEKLKSASVPLAKEQARL